MNYRHGFHAGNFADVFKHVFVVRILLYLLRKETPIRFIDTHAGRGEYDLAGASAARSQEWRSGIGCIEAAPPPEIGTLLEPYLDIVGERDAEGRPIVYPGSPRIARMLLRPLDRLLLDERHPEEVAALRRAMGRDRRVKILDLDAYVALNAAVPPKERRGLVLIDPPYEVAGEFARLDAALDKALAKWPTGVYAVWYPIKEPGAVDAFAQGLGDRCNGRLLRLELLIDRGPKPGAHDTLALIGCGLMIVNPPHVLETEARVLLPYLSARLSLGGRGSWRIGGGRDLGS